MQYFAYIEITDGSAAKPLGRIRKAGSYPSGVFALQRIAAVSDIYPVFRELFRKRLI
jgi:uncharacterized sporulation protein YeaH/YhbH (DUF444 family)